MKTLKNIGYLVVSLALLNCKADTKPTPKLATITTITTASKPKTKNTIKVALLLDTSNSMDGLIDQAKSQLWEIVNELSYAKCEHERPNLNIALYEYGNDNLPANNGYIRQVSSFTNDLDLISEKLFSLTTRGGSEHCGQVIKTSIDELEWGKNKNDLKLVFIAGNEPFTQGPVNYIDATSDAKEKDISINTIFCGSYNHGVSGKWQEGAQLANGEYMAIDHNQKTIHIASPYDDLILQLNIKLNKTYIPYGTLGKYKQEAQAMQDSNASQYGKSNVVSRTVSKSSKFYSNSSWDLVDAEEEDDFSYDKVEKKQLPKELQNLSKDELKKHVALKKSERERIQNEIQELNKKRIKYVADEKKKNGNNNGLENALLNTIKKQAEKKNYKWDK